MIMKSIERLFEQPKVEIEGNEKMIKTIAIRISLRSRRRGL